jgi:hypothetical protein
MGNLQGVNLEEVMANVAASLVSQRHTFPLPYSHALSSSVQHNLPL